MKTKIYFLAMALLCCFVNFKTNAQTGNYTQTLPNMQSVYYQTQVTFTNTPDNATSGTISCSWLGCQDAGIGNPTFYCYILLSTGYQTFASYNAASYCGFVSFSQPISASMLNDAIDAGNGSVILRVNVSDGCPAGMGCSCCNDPYINNLTLSYNYSKAGFMASNASICPSETISFVDTTPLSVTSRKWYFPGGNPSFSTAASPSITYSTPGNYNVALVTVSGAGTDSSFRAGYITVKTPPAASATAGGATTFCSGGSVTLSANTGSGLSYQWRKNGNAISNAINATYSAKTTGNYSVIVTSSNGCSAISSLIPVSVNPLPTAVITAGGPTTFCPGSSVLLSANTGSGFTYVWKKSNVTISGATNSTYLATVTGTYKVIVANANGCTKASNNISVTVNAPVATVTAQGPTTVCNGAGVTLQANTGSGLTYQWKLNNTNILGATGSSYTAYTSGTYKVVVTNSCGSKTSTGTVITVNPLPPATIAANGPLSFCSGSSVTLSANTGAGLTYLWKKNGTAVVGATGSSYIASATGSYTVEVTNASGCTNTSSAKNVTVNNTAANISASGPTTFCNGDSVLLNANTGVNLSYQWLKNNTNISGATTAAYTAKAAGTYKVIVTNTATSCAKTSTGIQVVINCKIANGTADEFKIDVTPNPFSGTSALNIINNDEPATINIYNEEGKLLETYQSSAGKKQFIVGANWTAGIFLVKVNQGGREKTFRLVKKD